MKRTSLFASLLALCLLGAASAAYAHHSGSMYDQSALRQIRGVVKQFAWTNPHCTVVFASEPAAGKASEEWTLELTSPGVLTRAGWTKRSLKPGDRIEVDVAPLRAGGPAGSLRKVKLLDTGETLIGGAG